jgi:hypothetical protein
MSPCIVRLGQFGNEKDNPSKCRKTAHSAATIVFRMAVLALDRIICI